MVLSIVNGPLLSNGDEKIGQITHGRSVSKGIGISRIPGRGAN